MTGPLYQLSKYALYGSNFAHHKRERKRPRKDCLLVYSENKRLGSGRVDNNTTDRIVAKTGTGVKTFFI